MSKMALQPNNPFNEVPFSYFIYFSYYAGMIETILVSVTYFAIRYKRVTFTD